MVGGAWGPLTLIAYGVLRARQTWLARYQTPHHRLQSGIDGILHIVDWLPVRLVGVVYALVGHGEKALPAWFASLGDRHSSQYQVLTRLAQYSLAREPHVDKVATPKAAVSMAKKTSLVVVVIMALLTIYGTWCNGLRSYSTCHDTLTSGALIAGWRCAYPASRLTLRRPGKQQRRRVLYQTPHCMLPGSGFA